jgi:hypothetical protein
VTGESWKEISGARRGERRMILLTPDLRERLLANGRKRNVDHVPVVKFFNPLGAGTWLATELGKDGDQLFGLADLGFPELGYFSPHIRKGKVCTMCTLSVPSIPARFLQHDLDL